ncbi:MAG: peptidoglycan recognition family protein [Planctomycetota bacterium]
MRLAPYSPPSSFLIVACVAMLLLGGCALADRRVDSSGRIQPRPPEPEAPLPAEAKPIEFAVEPEPAGPTAAPTVTPSDAAPRPIGSPLRRDGQEIRACGQLFYIGTPVVLFHDPGGFDAYRPHRFFEPEIQEPVHEPERLARFGSHRRNLPPEHDARVRRDGWTLPDLRESVSQVVVHYDMSGTSWNCFKVLHDVRGLSCHFLLDVDGTLYQTLDLKERAWHAGVANDASIGIEIAHIGARRDPAELKRWYPERDGKAFYQIPRLIRGRLPEEYVGIPARPGLFDEVIHGARYYQYDYTEEQYRALERLLVGLSRIFPKLEPNIPRDGNGELVWVTLPNQGADFRGVIGHHHLTRQKQDPGPAFDWERIDRVLSKERNRRGP